MNELALHILDIAENSVRAGASLIEITVAEDTLTDTLTLSVIDNGKGIPLGAKLADPFHTTKEGKRFGLGIPLFRQHAEDCGGGLTVVRRDSGGTRLVATFRLSHIDLMPLGDLGATVATLVAGGPDRDFLVTYRRGAYEYVFDTRKLRLDVEGLPLNVPAVLEYIKQEINEGLRRSHG